MRRLGSWRRVAGVDVVVGSPQFPNRIVVCRERGVMIGEELVDLGTLVRLEAGIDRNVGQLVCGELVERRRIEEVVKSPLDRLALARVFLGEVDSNSEGESCCCGGAGA